jgi:hypothetical protein
MATSTIRALTACACLTGGAVAIAQRGATAPIELPFRFTTTQPIIDVGLNGGARCRSSWTPAPRFT